MQKRNVINSPRLSELKQKKRNIFIRKVIVFGVLIVLIVASLSFISRIRRLNIYGIQVAGNKVIDTEVVRARAEKELAGKYLWLFPKTNIFLYPKTKIKNNLANEFKRFSSVNISVQNGRTLSIAVSERSPEYTWCGVSLPTVPGKETCYFLDNVGYIFDQAPYFSGDVYFKFYGATEPASENPSGTYLAKGYFNKLILFRDTLLGLGLKPTIAYLPDGEDAKIILGKSKSDIGSPEIIFKKNADYEKIAENLKAALDTEPFKSKFKNSYSTLQYIDLRFGNKVYYKF